MDNILYIVIVVLAFGYIIKRSIYHLHMYQLNSYRIERYNRFLKSNYKKIITPAQRIYMIILLISSFAFTMIQEFQYTLILFLWIGLTLFRLKPLFFSKEKTKKPIVFTMRVKRLCLVMIIIYSILLLLLIQISNNLFGLTMVMFITPIVMLFANLCLKPFEAYLKKHYYNDAKKLLRDHKDLIVIGITGSYGKTSTKFILETILSQQFTTLVTPHSYNTTLGVILTVRNKLTRSHEIFVAEMGAKQKGDIKEICDLVNPDYGIITAVGPQHLETFGSLSNVIDTKFELALAAKRKAIVNGDSNNVQEGIKRQSGVKFIKYGSREENDIRIDDINQTIHGSTFTIISKYGKQVYQTKLLGMHNILNIAGAIGMALELGMSYDKISTGVKEIKPVEHRLELKKQGDYYILDDAFNSNPTGARFALEVLDQFESGKKIIMTPGMIELGDMDEEVHFEFGKQIAKVCDEVILIGENKTRHIVKGLEAAGYNMEKVQIKRNVYEGFGAIRSMIRSGDVVLIENDLPDNFNE